MPIQYMTVYVVNEEGNVWAFELVRKGENFEASQVKKTDILLPRPIVSRIFAGNATVHEVVYNG